MADLYACLSQNFSLGELLRSSTAERIEALQIEQENPPKEVIQNLLYLVQNTLQPLRDQLGFPIHITSGYRSPGFHQRVGGSPTSQHLLGEATDCQLSARFLTDPSTAAIRANIEAADNLVQRPLRSDVSANFYLFAYTCLHLEALDIDQVIHEYGFAPGQPAWVHLSASTRQSRRQMLSIGAYTGRAYLKPRLAEALAYGT